MIVGRPNLELGIIRETCKRALNEDLSTVIKGSNEPLALLSKLLTHDEYNQPTSCQYHLHYTILIITRDWVLLRLNSIFSKCIILSEQTVQSDVYLSLLTGSLADLVLAVKEHSYSSQVPDVLSVLNKIQFDLESEGYTLLFKEFNKEKILTNFSLRRK